MNEVLEKYPWHQASEIVEAWNQYQMVQQGTSFLEFYERTLGAIPMTQTHSDRQKCCDKCKVRPLHNVPPAFHCYRPACPCHKTELSQANPEPPHQDFIEETLEEFRELFVDTIAPTGIRAIQSEAKPIETFLKEKLKEATQAERTRIIGVINKFKEDLDDANRHMCQSGFCIRDRAKLEALDEVIQAIGDGTA